MKVVAGAIFVLAGAVLFGAEIIAEAAAQGRILSYGGAPTVAAALLAVVGLCFIASGVADPRTRPDDPYLEAVLRRALKARKVSDAEPPRDDPGSVADRPRD